MAHRKKAPAKEPTEREQALLDWLSVHQQFVLSQHASIQRLGGVCHGIVVPAEFGDVAPGAKMLGYDLIPATTRGMADPPLLVVRMPWRP